MEDGRVIRDSSVGILSLFDPLFGIRLPLCALCCRRQSKKEQRLNGKHPHPAHVLDDREGDQG